MMNIARHFDSRRVALACIVGIALAIGVNAGAARADFGLTSFSTTYQDASGAPVTQAGAHADVVTEMRFNTAADASPDEQVKDVRVNLPRGLYGNPRAAATCTPAQLIQTSGYCAPDAQVGLLVIQIAPDASDPGSYFPSPLYNMAAAEDEPASLAAFVIAPLVKVSIAVRSDSDYGLEATLSNLNQGLPVFSSRLIVWGNPSDPAHDAERYATSGATPTPAGGVLKPFMTLPSRCEPTVSTVSTRSWQNRSRWVEATSTSPALTGCDRLSFEPTIHAQPVVKQADKPTGFDVDLSIPQPDAVNSLGTPALRKATVQLPDGLAISPASASGLQACTDAQLSLGTRQAAACPDASKVGTVSIDTPLLDGPLEGQIVIGSPTPEHLFRIFIVAQGHGIFLKLPGVVDPNETTGQLTTVFENTPELPFSRMRLHFKGGDRAPLAMPQTCGTKATTSELTSWAGSTASPSDSFVVSGCTGGFAPTFEAGSLSAAAGSFSPFTMTLRRNDGDQNLAKIDVKLPPGLLGILAGVSKCADAAAAAGTCDATSQVGTTTVESGSGGQPFGLPGKVFLAGPYKGAPFSLSVVVRAVAGPYDLGTVVVRVALFVDPVDAHVTAVSEPLPTILKGVPLRLRTINVTLDRTRFMRTPTNCTASVIGASLQSTSGGAFSVSTPFQAANCVALPLGPKLDLVLSGKGQTTDGKHPAIAASLTQPSGQANLKKVSVELPLSLALDPDNSQSDRLCEFEAGAKTIPDCPASSIVGTATAVTPVLDQPLTGPVYFIKNVRVDPKSGRRIKTLPTLATVLEGEGVRLVVRATTAVVNDKLVTTFDNLPDAPVSKFVLNMAGGAHGILTVSGADICKSTQIADQRIDGHNGKAADADVVVRTPACPLKVVSKKVGKTSVAVKVSGLGAGKVTVTGRGIRKTTKTITTSTVTTITAKRTKAKPGKVTVSFDPAGPAKVRKISK